MGWHLTLIEWQILIKQCGKILYILYDYCIFRVFITILYCRLLSYCRDSKVLYCCTVETVILETAVPCLLAAITQLPIPIHYCTISPFSENYEQNSDTGVWLKVKKFISFAFSANMDKWIICGLMGECKFFFWGPISRNTSKMMFLSDQTLT